ncbi:MAG: hypothetical protein HDR42_00765 [Lactobacillus sp.]|nr:hypothetical protein [Lactobacillus sp.]
MLTNNLIRYLKQKYGLTFKQMLTNNRNIFVLMVPNSKDFFAILSRVPNKQVGIDKPGHAVTLDLKCGEFSKTLIDLPGFTKSFRIKSNQWIGMWLNQVNDDEVKKIVDYAYKLALNGEIQTTGQYLLIPEDEESENTLYHAETIPPRKNKQNNQSLGKRESDIPQEIEKMLQSYDYTVLPALGRQKNFYHQGQLMADYEDDYNQNFTFTRFYPTYHDMTVHQLRTYFTWRTKVRKGIYESTSRSYVFIYIYELLNQIGVKNPEEGYQLLKKLYEEYVLIYDSEIKKYLNNWRKDYVTFYNLEKYKDEVFTKENKKDDLYEDLLRPTNSINLSNNLKQLSTYHGKSPLEEQTYQQLVFFVWRKLLANKEYFDFAKEVLFTITEREYYFFSRAILYNRVPHFDTFQVSSSRKFYQKNGHTYYQYFSPVARQRTKINAVLHEIDRISRIEYQMGRKLKTNNLKPAIVLTIEQAVKEFHATEIEAQRPKIKINFDHLDKIRLDASKTRESLLTEEEKELELETNKEQEDSKRMVESQIERKQVIEKEIPYGLSKDEYFFLMALWHQTSWKKELQQEHLMTSILVDSINEKLFDEIGDSLIEFNGDEPIIIEDYLPDLLELFGKEE